MNVVQPLSGPDRYNSTDDPRINQDITAFLKMLQSASNNYKPDIANKSSQHHVRGFEAADIAKIQNYLATGQLDQLTTMGFTQDQIKQLRDNPRLLGVAQYTTTYIKDNHNALTASNSKPLRCKMAFGETEIPSMLIDDNLLGSMVSHYEGKGAFSKHKIYKLEDLPLAYRSSPHWTEKLAELNKIAESLIKADQEKFGGLYNGISGGIKNQHKDALIMPPDKYRTSDEALTGVNDFLKLLSDGLEKGPDVKVDGKAVTLRPYELEIIQRILSGEIKDMDDLHKKYPKHINLPSSTLNKLFEIRQKDPKATQVGLITTKYLLDTPNVSAITDDGAGVYGISKQDLQALQAPAGQPLAISCRNQLITHVNKHVPQLVVNQANGQPAPNIALLSGEAKIDPAVYEAPPALEPGTEKSGEPVLLSAKDKALVDTVRQALFNPDAPVDIANANRILSKIPYRARIQMIRYALRDDGTPESQINKMTEEQVRTQLKARLFKTDPKAYFELIKDGNPELLKKDLAELETQKDQPVIKDFLDKQKPYIDSLKKASKGPAQEDSPVSPHDARKTALAILQTLSNGLNDDPKRTITKDDIKMLQGLMSDDDAKAAEHAKALSAKLGIDEATLLSWREDPAQRKVAKQVFIWLQQNQHDDAPLSSIVEGDGEGISGKDLAKFLNAMNGVNIKDNEVRGRANDVIASFNIFCSNNLSGALDKPKPNYYNSGYSDPVPNIALPPSHNQMIVSKPYRGNLNNDYMIKSFDSQSYHYSSGAGAYSFNMNTPYNAAACYKLNSFSGNNSNYYTGGKLAPNGILMP